MELGEKRGQAVNVVSRCLWDTATDGFASESYETETLYCNCQVGGPGGAGWEPTEGLQMGGGLRPASSPVSASLLSRG